MERVQNPNPDFYEAMAPFYDEVYSLVDAGEAVRHWRELLRISNSECELRKGVWAPRLIDVGCGTGRHLEAWHSFGFEIAGCDMSPEMLHLASNRVADANIPCPLFALDIRNPVLPHALPQFDIATSHFNFLNLFSPEELPLVFAGMATLVRPGGFWITDFSAPSTRQGSARTAIALNSGQWLHRAGKFHGPNHYEQHWKGSGLDAVECYWFILPELPTSWGDQYHGWTLRHRAIWRPNGFGPGQAFVDIYQRD